MGDPSTLWRLYRPLYGLVRLFPFLVIRPLCGGCTVHFMDLGEQSYMSVVRLLCGHPLLLRGFVHLVDYFVPSNLWA